MTPARAWLVDERWEKAYELHESTTIGRGASSAIILRDPAVSRLHAEVYRTGNSFVLRALGSSGTSVNGMRMGSECELHEGDKIEIAFTTLRFTAKAPTSEMFVLDHDRPTEQDNQEGPTRATLRAVKRPPVFGEYHPRTSILTRLARWLTGRANTD